MANLGCNHRCSHDQLGRQTLLGKGYRLNYFNQTKRSPTAEQIKEYVPFSS